MMVVVGGKMKYYHDHSDEYIGSTFDCSMDREHDFVLPFLKKGARILDVGFGSGRDMVFFGKLGFEVSGIDAEEGFVRRARSLGLDVTEADVRSFVTDKRYDLVWCSASLLHLKRDELLPTVSRLRGFLKEDGILYLSLKYTEREDGYDEKGRYFTYFHERDLESFPFRILKLQYTDDPTRDYFKWIEMILPKKD